MRAPLAHALAHAFAACAALALAACASAPLEPLHLTRPVVLLGEVHDNLAQHALRLQARARRWRWSSSIATSSRPSTACWRRARGPTPMR
jgi:hypothetical protein